MPLTIFCTLAVFMDFISGLRVSAHYGNFHQRSPTDLEFGTFDADKAISISLEHSSRSLERDAGGQGQDYAYLQCAILHTTVAGKRRVRTINLAVQVAALAGNVFRFADMDAAVCHFTREGERSFLKFLFSFCGGRFMSSWGW